MSKYRKAALRNSAHAASATIEQLRSEREDQRVSAQLAKILFYKTGGRVMLEAAGASLGTGRFIGNGGEQIVFGSKNDKYVRKLLINTLGFSADQADKAASDFQELSDTAQDYLGDFWLETRFDGVKLPWLLGGDAVVAVQPRITPVRSFAGPLEIAAYSASSEYKEQLLEFTERIRELNDATGMLPDLGSNGNIILDIDYSGKEKLKIVDTIPVTPLRLGQLATGTTLTRREIHEATLESWQEAAGIGLKAA
jgi:hypothetical protein